MASRLTPIRDIEFKYNLSIYFSFLKKYRWMFALIVFLIFVMEILHLLEKYLFKLVIDNGTEFSAGVLSESVFVESLIMIAVYFVILTLVFVFLYFMRPHLLNRLNTRIVTDMKRKFFKHILDLDHNFHTAHKTGSLISRLVRGASAMERMSDILAFNFLPLIIQLVVVSITIAYFDVAAVMILLGVSFSLGVYSFYIQRLQEESSISANKTEDLEKGNMADFFTNVDSIKYYGKENVINKKYKELSENTRKGYLRNWDYFRLMRSGQSFIIGLGTLLLISFVMIRFLEGGITLGTVAFIYTAYGSLLMYMFGFVAGLRNLYRAMADFQELFQYNKLNNEIKDKPDSEELRVRKGEVEFRDVSFQFGRRKIFDKFNLKIRENEKIALVGHSGSGKTTLIKLLKRFYDIDEGSVLIDGKDIKDLKQESVRSEIGIVPQECILFDDTVYNNVKFSNPRAPREEVLKAIKFAQLDKVIESFPDKERTIVGERGVRLSGGEKQRVSIARAILANKKILVLDEATSALDSETEYEIQKDLKELLKGRTSLIIAHRLSTIMNADRIIVMKNGKIVQEGKHFDLIKSGEYKKLWNLQKGGYIK